MDNYGTHFPNNRDGGVSGVGRTKARFLQAELPGLPFASARRKSADGMTDITARKRGDGFTEVRLQQQEAEWTQDAWVVNTRDWFDKDTLRMHSRLKSRKPKPGSSETPMWRAWQDLPKPLGELDPVSMLHHSRAYSMGGNGSVFVSAVIAKDFIYDIWDWRFLKMGGSYSRKRAQAAARAEVNGWLAETGGRYIMYGGASVERVVGIWAGAPGASLRRVGQVRMSSFLCKGWIGDPSSGYEYYKHFTLSGPAGSPSWVQDDVPGNIFFVDGARWRGRYEAAVAYGTVNEQGWHVARVRVFDDKGWYIETDVAADAGYSWRPIGFWRLGPGRLMLLIDHIHPYGIEGSISPGADWGDWRYYGHKLPTTSHPMYWLALSNDGGRSWERAPENALLSSSNEEALRIVEEWSQGSIYHRSLRVLHQHWDVAALSGDSCFVVSLYTMSYREKRPDAFYARGVLKPATGGVSNLHVQAGAQDYDPSYANIGSTWQAFSLPPAKPGQPLRAGMVTDSRINNSYYDAVNDPRMVWISEDGAASFQRVGPLPAPRWSCSAPRALTADAVHVVDVSAKPPLTISALVQDGAQWRWQRVADNLGLFRMYIREETAPSWVRPYLGVYVQQRGPFPDSYMPIRANGNPTPHAPWLSDDRKEAP